MSDSNAFPVLAQEKAALLRALVQELLAARRGARAATPPAPAPRYDAVFFQGVAWLERLSCDESFEETASPQAP